MWNKCIFLSALELIDKAMQSVASSKGGSIGYIVPWCRNCYSLIKNNGLQQLYAYYLADLSMVHGHRQLHFPFSLYCNTRTLGFLCSSLWMIFSHLGKINSISYSVVIHWKFWPDELYISKQNTVSLIPVATGATLNHLKLM